MTTKGILALSVFTICMGLSFIGVIDAAEAGLTISELDAPVIGAALATLSAASIGIVVGNRVIGRKKDDPDTPKTPES